MEGWLLDVCLDNGNGVFLWLRGKCGVVKRAVGWRARLYAAGPSAVLRDVARTLSDRYEVRPVVKRVPDAGFVDALEVFTPPAEKRWLANVIAERWGCLGVKTYNTDIPLLQEFLYEHGLTPTAYVKIHDNIPEPAEDVNNLFYDTSFLRVAFLDVEAEASGPLPRFSDGLRLVRVRVDGDEAVLDGCEDEILQSLTKLLDEWDVDVVVTHGGDGFLMRYLRERASANNVKLRLGRGEDRVKSSKSFSYTSYGRVHHRFGGYKLNGRLHIDADNSMLYGETGIEGVLEVARVVSVPVQDAARYTIGRCMTSLQYRQAYLNDVLIPSEPGRPTCMTAAELVTADRGGWILDHRPGVYWNVGELDFHSLYPTLMLKHNISGETVNCKCCEGSDIPELGYHVCRRWRGIVPSAVETPLKRRLEYKRLYMETGLKIYKARSDALKWILVTSFGYLGYRKAKFGSREAHMAVCALARDTLLKSVKIAEEKGFKVLHGIVDCLWVWGRDACEEDYRKLGEELEKRLGLPIGYEGTYRWIAFLPSRTHPGRPVNNRYFGVYTDGRLKFRGIELRRSDTPPLAKQMQKEFLEKLAEAKSPEELQRKAEECRETFHKYLKLVYSGAVEQEMLALVRSLSMSPKHYRKRLKHVAAAKKLEQAGVNISPGQQVSYIVTNNSATPLLLSDGQGYKEEFYASFLRRCMETVLQPFLLKL
ncbi:MAG: DNA polymerase domain-containing protein [Candidatus Caldarchaeum sp.]